MKSTPNKGVQHHWMEWKRDSSSNLIIFCEAILLCMISRMLYVTTLPRDEAHCEELQEWNSLTKLERNIFGELLHNYTTYTYLTVSEILVCLFDFPRICTIFTKRKSIFPWGIYKIEKIKIFLNSFNAYKTSKQE